MSEFDDEYPSRRFEKSEIAEYVAICRRKAREALASETRESLEGDSGVVARVARRLTTPYPAAALTDVPAVAAASVLKRRWDTRQDDDQPAAPWSSPPVAARALARPPIRRQLKEPAVVTYCDVQGGYTGTGNINIDPGFISASTGNYRLAAGSPCIDAGQNSAVPSNVSTDVEGYPLFVDDLTMPDCQYLPGTCGTPPIVDIGAHEYQVASGACCTGMSCTVTTQPDCAGTWTAGITCTPDPCQTGSCCMGTTCTVATEANCAGTWTSGGTCSPTNPCLTGSCYTGTTCTVTTQANCAGSWTSGGTCSPDNPCQTGSCCVGTTCTVTTQANCAGTWTSGRSCTPDPCSTASTVRYTLTVGTSGSGTITWDPPGGVYEKGTTMRLRAAPGAGWRLVEWTGDAQGEESSVSVVMNGPRTVVARFEKASSAPAAAPAFSLCGASATEAGLATLLVCLLGPPVARRAFRSRSRPS